MDNSETINGVDLVELRKLILGLYQDLPENTSWRFVDSEYDFINPLDPWAKPIAESYPIRDLSENMEIDFVGVKVGDVNSSAIVNSLDSRINSRSQRWPVVITQTLTSMASNTTGYIKVTGENYERVSGWQGTIKFDATKIRFLSLKPGVLNISEDQINLTKLDDGMLAISYYSYSEENFEGDDVLFEIEVEALKHIENEEIFAMTSDLTAAEAYRGFAEVVPLYTASVKQGANRIVGVYPNPWAQNTSIEFEIKQDGEAQWEFYNAQGQLIYKSKNNYTKGNHTLKIEASDFDVQGVIYMKLKTKHDVAEFKMVKL